MDFVKKNIKSSKDLTVIINHFKKAHMNTTELVKYQNDLKKYHK